MAAVEVTREARDELRELIETHSLPGGRCSPCTSFIAFHDARTSSAATETP